MGLQMGDTKGVVHANIWYVSLNGHKLQLSPLYPPTLFPPPFWGGYWNVPFVREARFQYPPLPIIPLPLLSISHLTPPLLQETVGGGDIAPPSNTMLNAQYYLGQQ